MPQGHLKLVFLKELEKRDATGYDLIKRAEEILGKKPSPGSVYPLLEKLHKDKYIAVKKKGRKKEYWITPKGRRLVKKLAEEKEKMLISQERLLIILTSLDIVTIKKRGKGNKERISRENKQLLRNLDLLAEFKEVLDAVLLKENLSEKDEKKLRNILKGAIKKLRELS